jgi:hypothetical protein
MANRKAPTLWQRLNPIWWASDEERNDHWDWLHWFFRNPFANFTNTIIGIAHKDRDCYYSRSPWSFAEFGLNYGFSVPVKGWFSYPFISYRGTWIEYIIGWKTSGRFSMTLRRSNSKNATEYPT